MIEIKQQQLSNSQTDKPVKTRIQFNIPKKYHKDPIIFTLVLDYKLRVNLISAILGKDGLGGGCFDVELQGYRQQIEQGLNYLSQLDVDIWHRSDSEAISY
ncbi:MAG: NIL domain-containing protein [Waterburya sp.]